MNSRDPISGFIEKALEEDLFPGAVLWVQKEKEILYKNAWGYSALIPNKRKMTLDTLFDIASITKVMATGMAMLLLLQKNLPVGLFKKRNPMHLETRLDEIFPVWPGKEKGSITLRCLLSHSSGLPDSRPYYQKIRKEDQSLSGFMGSRRAKERIFHFIHREPLIYSPGTKHVYSDLDFILLGEIIEKLTHESLDSYCKREVFDPLGLFRTGFRPIKKRNFPLKKVASTEKCPWRARVLNGEVHDDNAYAMGGVGGHAGLFSTASDMGKFGAYYLSMWDGKKGLFKKKIVKDFSKRQSPDWGLSWMSRSPVSSSGKYFSESSFGHLGFTGTSLWIDPEKKIIVVFLTNRVHPTRKNNQLKTFRPKIHDLIFKELVND